MIIMMTFTSMGAVALAQLVLVQAQTAYLQALAVYEKAEQLPPPVESWAGLALVALQQNDQETAQTYADKVLAALDDKLIAEHGVELMRVFRITWQLCQLLELDDADRVLVAAGKVMQAYLDKQPDPALQKIYLQQPDHQMLWEAWGQEVPVTERVI